MVTGGRGQVKRLARLGLGEGSLWFQRPYADRNRLAAKTAYPLLLVELVNTFVMGNFQDFAEFGRVVHIVRDARTSASASCKAAKFQLNFATQRLWIAQAR